MFKGAKARVVILKCKPGAHTRGEPTREFSHSKRHPPTCTIFLNALEKKIYGYVLFSLPYYNYEVPASPYVEENQQPSF